MDVGAGKRRDFEKVNVVRLSERLTLFGADAAADSREVFIDYLVRDEVGLIDDNHPLIGTACSPDDGADLCRRRAPRCTSVAHLEHQIDVG